MGGGEGVSDDVVVGGGRWEGDGGREEGGWEEGG